MIVLKEIKVKDYMRGTKAIRLRTYIYFGMLAFTGLVSIPSYYWMQRKLPQLREKKLQRQKAEHEKLKIMLELQTLLKESESPDSSKTGTA